jgi:hypothetical protein
LIEESRTNLLSYSVPNSSWNLSSATITENAGIAPDGTNTAVLHSDNNTNNQHLLYTTATVSNATNYVITSYLKQPSSNSRRYYSMTIHGLGYVIFDVQNGTVHNSSGTGIQGASITAVGNGWYRVKAHYVTTSTNGNIYWLPIGDDGSSVVYTGASTAQGMLVWGCQLEQATYETSYIPTNGATATRGADIVLLDDIENEMGYNQLEGTVITDLSYTQDSDGAHTIFSFSGTESNPADQSYRSWLRINQSAGTPNTVRIYQNGNYNDSSATATSGVSQKVAYSYSSTDQDVSLNGTSVIDASRTPPTNLFRLAFGNIGWSLGLQTTALEGHIKRFMYYPKKLPNSQLNTLTS